MEKQPFLSEEEMIPQPDYDARWKEVIERFAPQLIQFLYSRTLWRDIDHSREVKPMTDELHKLFPDFKKKGKRYPDKLLKMYLKNGEEHFVIVHIEVERNPPKNIGEKTYDYFVRLRDRNPKAIITSLVIFIGNYIPKQCDVYTYKRYGTKLTYRYKVCKIKSLNEERLLKSKNPIALVFLAALYNIRTEGKEKVNERLRFKLKLAKLCFLKGYDKRFIRDLMLFIEFTIALPLNEQTNYRTEFESFAKKEIMPLVDQYPKSSIEVMEIVMYGKTLEEKLAQRDVLIKKQLDISNILRAYNLGLTSLKIAGILDLDVDYVQKVLEEHLKS